MKAERSMTAKFATHVVLNAGSPGNLLIWKYLLHGFRKAATKSTPSDQLFFCYDHPRHEPRGITGHKHITRGLGRRRCASASQVDVRDLPRTATNRQAAPRRPP